MLSNLLSEFKGRGLEEVASFFVVHDLLFVLRVDDGSLFIKKL